MRLPSPTLPLAGRHQAAGALDPSAVSLTVEGGSSSTLAPAHFVGPIRTLACIFKVGAAQLLYCPTAQLPYCSNALMF